VLVLLHTSLHSSQSFRQQLASSIKSSSSQKHDLKMASLWSTTALLLASASMVAATPVAMPRACQLTPVNSTSVAWYQGSMSFTGQSSNQNTACGQIEVSSGSMATSTCTNLYTAGMGIPQRSDRTCVFKLWEGDSTCASNSSWTEIVIPKGSETTCINTGVLDGGVHYKASGIYTCN